MARAHARGDLDAASPWLQHGFKASMTGPTKAAVAVDETGIVGAVLPDLKALVVEPVRRMQGIGERLVEAGCAIEGEQGNAALVLGVRPGDRRGEQFLEATGFAFHSSVWDLELASDVAVAAPSVPDGYAARPFRRETDLDTWVTTFNEAFRDHPTPLQLDPAGVAQWIADPEARDDDTILIEDDRGRIAAFCATEPRYRPDGSVISKAEIWALGVRPGLQGRGLGRVALRLGIAWLRALGVDTVTLSVSGRNPRAVSLYEAEGFVRVATRDRWSRPVDGPPDLDDAA